MSSRDVQYEKIYSKDEGEAIRTSPRNPTLQSHVDEMTIQT